MSVRRADNATRAAGETRRVFSLSRRLLIAIVASQFLLAAGLIVIGTLFARYYLGQAFDVYLEGRAQSIASIVYYADDGSARPLFNQVKIPPASHAGYADLFCVSTAYDNFERHSPGYDPHLLDGMPPWARYWEFRSNGVPYRAIVLRKVAIQDTEEGVPDPPPTLTVVYAAPTVRIDQQSLWLAVSIGVLSLLILIPTLLLALWNMRRALEPLRDLATVAGAISVDSWTFSPSEEARSTEELQPLIAAIGAVLEGLEKAFVRQREFLGDAAHELKTSLAILKSTLQTLLIRPREPGEYESGLAVMNRDCERLERLLNRMLETARAEQRLAGGERRRPEPVDLASSCEAAIARLAQFAAARGIEIAFAAEGEAMFRAEPADLELIWLNLLENAIQYSPRGTAVSMTLALGPETATVTVADSGCGIDPVHLPYIFERFYRADSSRARATGGVGLGLAITSSLVRFYHGRIHARSEPGRGTTITVEFPLRSAGPEPQAV